MAKRPRISRLFDHTLRVWRAANTKSDLGEEQRAYTVVGTGASLGAKLNRATDGEVDVGAGMAPSGTLRLYMNPGVDVKARDVLELVSGPDSPGTWEVDQPPVQPSGHHTQVDCVTWHGELPAFES